MNQSPFETLAPITGGLVGSAPALFTASTSDNEDTLTKLGYLNDFYENKQIKEQDWLLINYANAQSNLFLVKNVAKEHEAPSIQLVKLFDLKPPVPPSEE